MKKHTHICLKFAPRPPSPPLSTSFSSQGNDGDDVLIADGTVDYLRGDAGTDSCTLNGVKKIDSDGSKFAGCEP